MAELDKHSQRICVVRDLLPLAIAALAAALAAPISTQPVVITALACAAVAAGWAWVVSSRSAHALRGQLLTSTSARHTQSPREPHQDAAALERRQQVKRILAAADTLEVVYQPIIDLATGDVVGHEALSRFQGGHRPDYWFSEAHTIGMGTELEMLAIVRALEHPPRDGYISVNLSPSTLVSAAFRELLDERPAHNLVIELTEHTGVENYEALTDAVAHLHAAGGLLAVDDTGAGYASMLHVVSLGPDIIKIDRRLIAAIDTHAARQELARSLAEFARRTNADLLAEGIERQEELDTCHTIGIRYGQGYLLGPPQPVQQLAPSRLNIGRAQPS